MQDMTPQAKEAQNLWQRMHRTEARLTMSAVLGCGKSWQEKNLKLHYLFLVAVASITQTHDQGQQSESRLLTLYRSRCLAKVCSLLDREFGKFFKTAQSTKGLSCKRVTPYRLTSSDRPRVSLHQSRKHTPAADTLGQAVSRHTLDKLNTPD